MTQYWDILDDGSLAVWTHDQDPATDPPAATDTDGGYSWSTDGDGTVIEPPGEVYDLLESVWEQGVPSQASGLTAKSARVQMDMVQSARGGNTIQKR